MQETICCFGLCAKKVSLSRRLGKSNNYYIRRRLDQGGFSNIDLVYHGVSKKPRVLKRLLCYSQEDESKALREAKLHNGLPNHPNILRCYEYDIFRIQRHRQGAISEVCMVLDYCELGSLQNELDQRRPIFDSFSNVISLHILYGVCAALNVLLSLPTPLSHRDIKPGNVLFCKKFVPVLMDFGSVSPALIEITDSKMAGRWKDFSAENCSMAYRAPELFQPNVGTPITAKADIWSLGCLLYALNYFESPFDQVHARGDSMALATISPKIKFPTNVSVSPQVIDLIRRMLSFVPEARPSLSEVMYTLEEMEPSCRDSSAEVVHSQPVSL